MFRPGCVSIAICLAALSLARAAPPAAAEVARHVANLASEDSQNSRTGERPYDLALCFIDGWLGCSRSQAIFSGPGTATSEPKKLGKSGRGGK